MMKESLYFGKREDEDISIMDGTCVRRRGLRLMVRRTTLRRQGHGRILEWQNDCG